MRKYLGFIVLALLVVCRINAADISVEMSEDEKAIREIDKIWEIAWRECDAESAAKVFAEDADWMNSFGVQKKGREEIKKFFELAFSYPNAKEREDIRRISSIRFIRPDVALLYADFEVKKQRYKTGEEMADRKGHFLRVMVKENGKWEIASMFIMDEKSGVKTSCDLGWPKSDAVTK